MFEKSFFLALLDDLVKYNLVHGLVNADTKAVDLGKVLIHPVKLAWKDAKSYITTRSMGEYDEMSNCSETR